MDEPIYCDDCECMGCEGNPDNGGACHNCSSCMAGERWVCVCPEKEAAYGRGMDM